MTLRQIDWTSPEAYVAAVERRSRIWTLVRHVISAIGAYSRNYDAARERYRLSARGSPGLNNHLRRDIGLGPVYQRLDVDLYR